MLFAGVWTSYMLIGYEEADLATTFGDEYRAYAATPMILPFGRRS